jgi:hypothetical protein
MMGAKEPDHAETNGFRSDSQICLARRNPYVSADPLR